MEKIVYLFGAGASCHCLPIVNSIPARIENLINVITNQFPLLIETPLPEFPNNKTNIILNNEFITDLTWMKGMAEAHASIDTAAKKLYIKRNTEQLDILKLTLSAFFVLEQNRIKPDKRYDAFFASLLDASITKFPPQIKILSWNYDSQFEIAFSEYSSANEIRTNQSFLNLISKNNRDTINTKIFGLYKLNGTTSLSPSRGFDRIEFCDGVNTQLTREIINNVIYRYALSKYKRREYFPELSFAWEKEWGQYSVIDSSIEAIKESSVLVVVGYSFPFFNREIDRKIISNMPSLRKVYFQSPEAPALIQRFRAVRDDLEGLELIPITDVEQFFLPYEL